MHAYFVLISIKQNKLHLNGSGKIKSILHKRPVLPDWGYISKFLKFTLQLPISKR